MKDGGLSDSVEKLQLVLIPITQESQHPIVELANERSATTAACLATDCSTSEEVGEV